VIKPIYNNYLIKPVISDNPLNLIGFNGVPMILKTTFEPLRYTPQFGEIVAHPIESDGKHELLPIGTQIFFHYIVCEEKKRFFIEEKEHYLCPTDLVWAYIEDKELVPTENIVICELVNDDRLNEGNVIIREYEERVDHVLKVVKVCKELDNTIYKGYTLYTVKHAGMPIPDSDLVFIKKVNILCFDKPMAVLLGKKGYYQKKMFPMQGKHLILEDEIPDTTYWKGLIVGDMHRMKFQTGTYLDGEMKLLRGRSITFIHSMSTRLEVEGVKYAVVTNNDLIVVN
jgi:hypothetical protein